MVKSYSRHQKTVALSSAEAEFHDMVAASSEALGVQALMRDMGMELDGDFYSDASAALGISQGLGCGKVQHVRTKALWVKEVRLIGRLKYSMVLGSANPADILSKHVPADLLD